MTPVYTPPADEKEDEKREIFFKHTIPVYPDSEFLHHCVHATGTSAVVLFNFVFID